MNSFSYLKQFSSLYIFTQNLVYDKIYYKRNTKYACPSCVLVRPKDCFVIIFEGGGSDIRYKIEFISICFEDL